MVIRFLTCSYSQTSTHASTFNAHRLESVRHSVLIQHAVFVSRTAPPIRIQSALPMVQHMITNAGTN